MKDTYTKRFKICNSPAIPPSSNSDNKFLKARPLLLVFVLISSFSVVRSQCGSEAFPDQWTVHELETSELPYRSVYIYANTDIDGDGKKDIVTGGWWYKNPGSASGNWVRNTIGGSFKNMAYIHDFDGDGDPDLLGTTGAYEDSDMVWAQNNGSGNFTIRTNIPSGDTNYSEPFLAGIAGANFQSGGPFQMAINWNGAESTDSPVQMLTVPSNPVSTTWPLVDISSSSLGEDLQAGDIDGDGDLDLFQSKNWLRNNGNGTWSTINTGIDYPTTPDRAQLADFDGDGDLDAVVGQLSIPSSNSGGREFSWFEAPSNPANNWIRHILATDINGSLSVYAEDIDQDGDQDIVVGEWRGSKRLIAFENDLCDSGAFIRHTINSGGNFDHHDGARVVDIDDDGDFDVVSIGWDNIVPRIFENTSSTPSNQDPIANAGSNQNITLPNNTLTINGSGNDPDGGNVTFAWTQTSGPNTATLSNENTSDLTVSDLIEGTYVFRLTVTDDENDTDFDEMSVTVNPEANTDLPLADAGSDQNIALPTNSITINGSGSDPDGGNVTFSWTQTSGPNTATLSDENTADLSASNLIEGTYVLRLTVTDDENDTSFDEVSLTVNPETNSDLPEADAGADLNIMLPTNSMTLNGSGSDPDGGNVTFTWTQTSGPNTATLSNENTADLSASNLIEGTYVFRLTVTDDENETAFDEISVIVLPEGNTNQPLVAVASATPISGEAPLEVQFDGTASTDDTVIETYSWNFDDGETSSDADPIHTFNEVGVYSVELIVTDEEGLTNQNVITITVTEPESIPEVTGVSLESNPISDGIAKINLVGQPQEIQIAQLRLHDMIGRFVREYPVHETTIGNGSYELPVATLRDGPYYLRIELSNGTNDAFILVVRN